ncbi:NAD(P)-dependent alcohol dehydrogenase [Nitrosomonas sp. JL21]|uniref:NADPH-dependent aldehyde reductase Ahr n=1 Tax=Nitrosomonas sp. JL21 TaxID=153949 RepID=UPI001368A1C6|nr:NAD(P)-dependent alcohol dehydrogenase [Nitrosomonas sp. JL21]MBL8496349.1 NAD(P)-dependent alcohol dehydrogenase [Nitrosomonas sp.]MXS77377.1 NAD(P)-dependent alcohol dehydrogenase [Nitrosomonas sp. JL21]
MIKAYAAQEAGATLQMFEYDPGPLDVQDVEIDLEHCGICHSDLSMLNNEWGITQFPFVPGHEIIGIISAVGTHVHHLQPGDRVGLGWHSGYCLTCSACMSGDHNLCDNAEATIVGRYGGFAEKVRANAASVVVLPENMDPQSAGPLFCGGITVFNPLLQFNIAPTASVAVIGIGGLGHIALQFLKAWGCHVTAFTSSDHKKTEALELGADEVLDTRKLSDLKNSANRFDLILSTVNVKLDWNLFIATLRPKGRLHFVGATLTPLDINIFPLISAQRSLSGSPVGSPASIKTMLAFAERHQIKPIVEAYRFDQVNEALARLASGKVKYRIVISNQ